MFSKSGVAGSSPIQAGTPAIALTAASSGCMLVASHVSGHPSATQWYVL